MYPLITIIIIAVAVLVSLGNKWYAVMVLICGFPLLAILLEWFRGTKARHRTGRENCLKSFFSLLWSNRARYGGFVVHIGVILIALGIIGSSFYSIERTATLEVGQSVDVGKYEFTYDNLVLRQGFTKVRAVAEISASKNSHMMGTLYPEYNYWHSQGESFAEVAVRTAPVDDLFVSMAWTSHDPLDKSATFRIIVNPLVMWIWIGGGFMLLGGAISFMHPIKLLNAKR